MKKGIVEGDKENGGCPFGSPEAYKSRKLDQIAARWDAKAATWDRELKSPRCHLNEDEAYSRFVRETKRLISLRRDFCARHGVIDAGCGTGLVLGEIRSFFAWGIGVDISPQMIARAKAKNIPKAEFLVGDCFELMTLCPRAAAVVSRGVLLSHYGAHAGAALLRAAHNALIPGGFLIVDFLNEAGRSKAIHAPGNKEYLIGTKAKGLARRAGFRGVEILGEDNRRVLLLFGQVPSA